MPGSLSSPPPSVREPGDKAMMANNFSFKDLIVVKISKHIMDAIVIDVMRSLVHQITVVRYLIVTGHYFE